MIILFMICCYAMASIIVEQNVFEEPRTWLKTCTANNPNWFMRKICALVSCMFCTGTWCGMILYFMGFDIMDMGTWSFFFSGLVGGFSAWLGFLLMSYLERVVGIE
jgi:hypothetical protein